MNEFPARLTSTLASDATEGRGVLPPWIGSLKPDARAVGPAFVALMSQDDNLSVREAIKASPPPGSVLVVAGGSTSRTETIGGLTKKLSPILSGRYDHTEVPGLSVMFPD